MGGHTTSRMENRNRNRNKDINKKEKPTFKEVLNYCKTISVYNSNLDYHLEGKYNEWVEQGWKDGYGKPIKNWKTKFRNIIPYLKPMKEEILKI